MSLKGFLRAVRPD